MAPIDCHRPHVATTLIRQVRYFIELAFKNIGITIVWRGKGVEEVHRGLRPVLAPPPTINEAPRGTDPTRCPVFTASVSHS